MGAYDLMSSVKVNLMSWAAALIVMMGVWVSTEGGNGEKPRPMIYSSCPWPQRLDEGYSGSCLSPRLCLRAARGASGAFCLEVTAQLHVGTRDAHLE